MPPGAGPPQGHLQMSRWRNAAARMMGMSQVGPSPDYQSAPQMQGQQFMGPGGQQYRPGTAPQQLGMPPSMQGLNPQQPQQFATRPLQQPQGQPSPQGSGMPFGVQQRPITSTPQLSQAQQQQLPQQQPTPTPPGSGNHALQPASSYPFSSSSSYSQAPVSYGLAPPFQVSTQTSSKPVQPGSQVWAGGQSNSHSGSLQTVQPPPASGLSSAVPSSGAADWQEHVAPDGRRYYYNRRSKQSS